MVKLNADFPGSLYTEGCKGCDPREKCLKCKYLYEKGGQCGGCHVFYIDEDQQDDYIESQLSMDSDSLLSKDMLRGLSARSGGEEEADEASPARRPLGNSPNDQDDSPKFYFRTKGGMVEDLDPELQSIIKHRKRSI